MAEFVLKDMVARRGLTEQFHIESAATSTEEIGNPVHPPCHHVLQHELGHSRSADVAVADEKDTNGRLGHGESLCKETDCLKDTVHIISQQPPSP